MVFIQVSLTAAFITFLLVVDVWVSTTKQSYVTSRCAALIGAALGIFGLHILITKEKKNEFC